LPGRYGNEHNHGFNQPFLALRDYCRSIRTRNCPFILSRNDYKTRVNAGCNPGADLTDNTLTGDKACGYVVSCCGRDITAGSGNHNSGSRAAC
jgi:hypothetical protein